jgi:hypothetical protein
MGAGGRRWSLVIAPATCLGNRLSRGQGIKPVAAPGSAGGAHASRTEPSRARRIGGALAAADLSKRCTIPAAEPQGPGRRAGLGGEYKCRRVNPLQEDIDHESGPCAQTGHPRTTETRSQVVHRFASRPALGLRRNQGPNVDHLRRSPIAKGWTLKVSAAGMGRRLRPTPSVPS